MENKPKVKIQMVDDTTLSPFSYFKINGTLYVRSGSIHRLAGENGFAPLHDDIRRRFRGERRLFVKDNFILVKSRKKWKLYIKRDSPFYGEYFSVYNLTRVK